jgi:hypothetical protein
MLLGELLNAIIRENVEEVQCAEVRLDAGTEAVILYPLSIVKHV